MRRLFLLFLLLSTAYTGFAQCIPNTNPANNGNLLMAPTDEGATASLNNVLTGVPSNMRADTYVAVYALVIGYEYQVNSSVATDYFTVRSGTFDGPVIAYGPQPLNFTAPASGTYFMHLNSDANCSKAAGGVGHYFSITLLTKTSTPAGCFQTTSVFTSMTAPTADNGTSTTSPMQAGAWTNLNNVVAGNTYTITSTIGSDYLSVRSGSSRGAIVVAGTQPVTFTAPVGGTYFVHLNTNEYCGADGTQRRLTTTRIYPDCNGIPTPGKAVTSNAGPVCPNASFTLSVDGNLEAKGITYQWQVSTTGESGPFTNIDGKTNATAIITGQAQSSWYRMVANCTISNQSAASAAVNVEQATNTTFYRDFDNDGFGDANQSIAVCSATAPTGYVSDNTDCYDNDASLNPNTIWYLDFDGDGYYTGSGIKSCLPPIQKGYKHTGLTGGNDCDDNNIDIHEPVQYYVDGDHDGYGSTTTALVCSLTATTGYATNNTDCNDGDATIHEPVQYYVDADHDGFGSTTIEDVCAATAPVGYSTNSTDCDDTDGTVHEPQQYYVDGDHDGFGSTATAMVCSSTATTGYSMNNTDCNDANANIHEAVRYYVDADRDGYGSTTTAMLCEATAPTGYSSNNTDCDDENAAVHISHQFYVDADQDGFGSTEIAMLCESTAPVGYATNNTDCNDKDATVQIPQQYFVDADLDGYGSTKTAFVCSSTATPGYATNSADCNDKDATIHEPVQYYVDADHDGFGSTTTEGVCAATAPVGYSTNSTDC
ncbi:MAG: hypothetical protein Q7T76_14505, partial [Ferruginibacter sp.]|nr:hypothetical protein [Ferruginibacter sp.]